MRVLAFFLVAVIGVLPFLETRDLHAASETEAAAARIPLEHYINAHATGNPDYIRKAFFPDAKIMAFRDGKLLNLSVEEFASRFSGKPAADESQRKRRIDSLTITGNAGVARIVLDYPDTTLTDYMSLLKVDGEWKIVNKVFNAEPKAKSTTNSASQLPDDREGVKQAVLDYVEALYEADSARIERSVHRDLFKLGFERDKDGTYKPYRMTYQELYDLAGRWNKTGRIPKNSKKEIVVYDVADQTASAKLTAMWGIDYLHLAKFDGKWMITDILWQTPPRS
ncbi:MAG TPA: nuclear transport factor 2 family protein [Pyrinomonadaceae bacterium]|nr:nuclear transport factor 2 family protein [Pyrinomonadaceae bacterium]